MSETELLNSVRLLDKKAFDTLFRMYYKQLCTFSYNMLRDKTLAEEIVQEFFIAIWEQPPLVADSVKSYFYKAIYNRTLNHIEKAKTRLKNEERFSIENEQKCELEDDDLELQNRIQNAIQELPEKCKEIFVLCKYNEMSYSQVSEMLSISPKTVENQMGIALKKLRERLLPFIKGKT